MTGANGQLGKSLKAISKNYASKICFVFKSSTELNVIDAGLVVANFRQQQYAYCINCAAYTNVDKAESLTADALSVNVKGAKNLAVASKTTNTVLVHISTDFVFDGLKSSPYTEEDMAVPIGSYGRSKLQGEKEIMAETQEYFILRTSWLYSEFGNNFMKSILKFGKEKDTLSVVYDQIGTPTYARDLAKFILKIVEDRNTDFGLYNFSNEGVASWYDFAKAIFDIEKIEVNLSPIRSSEYPLPARRPSYSVLDKGKIKRVFYTEIPYWRDSLYMALRAFDTSKGIALWLITP